MIQTALVGKVVLAVSVAFAVKRATGDLLRARGYRGHLQSVTLLAACAFLAVALALMAIPLWELALSCQGCSGPWSYVATSPLPLWSLLASALLIVSGTLDVACKSIPNEVILPGIMCGLCQAELEGQMLQAVLGASCAAFLFLLLYFFCPKGVGLGDVMLSGFIGIACRLAGLPIVVGAGLLLGGLHAAILLGTKQVLGPDWIPWGTLLALGGIIGLWCAAAGLVV